MRREFLHRFEHDGKQFVIDPETCFCFECDAISWDVLEYYPELPVNEIYHRLRDKYERKELAEVIGEIEWLRATRSILTVPKQEEMAKIFEVERGVNKLTVALSRDTEPARQTRRSWFGRPAGTASSGAREFAREAVALLLARSMAQKDLHIEFVEVRGIHNAKFIAEVCTYALRAAKLAGKNLTAAVQVSDVALPKTPAAVEGHAVSVCMDFQDAANVLEHVRAFAQVVNETLSRLAKAIQPAATGVAGRIIVRPNHPRFGGVVEELDKAGFSNIELDLDGAYAANPKLDPQSMLPGLSQSANYYAQQLLKHHYFRLDPIAALFWRIYGGTPLRRSDPVGTNELAVDEGGAVYPCWRMRGIEPLRLGSLVDGRFDEDRMKRFEDVGSLTTRECIQCWARNLCGGGTAAVHHAFTGSFRTPHGPWCDAQRSWMGAAVSAFQQLSSKGVHFDRIYKTLARQEKPSLFTLARAALTMTIGVRQIEEADAEMLTKWENWNESAYFLCTETGVFLATKYDREMESLHPRGTDQELVLIRKNGDPLGLLKVRPEQLPGAATAWVYMRNEADYASESIRKGFRAILKEAGAQQSIRRLVVPVSPKEQELAAFLEAVGFKREGVLREALYLHGAYQDVTVYSITTDAL
jgi:uncharacterized protein